MTVHSINTPVTEPQTISSKAEKNENLKQRAYLNSLSSIIDYAGVQITGFIINPFLVTGLGTAMYGVWQILGQLTGYTKLADTRASQALKWSLANKRDIAAETEFKSDLTTAFYVTAIILPLSLIIGGTISWYSPLITQGEEKYFTLIRTTCAILISSLIINKFFDLFEAVLGGMNLGYKRMGLRATIVGIGGLFKVLAITQGYGLIGLSIVQFFISIITGVSLYYIVKKNVPWFAFGKTNFSKIKSFGKLSSWFMAFSTLKMILLNSDKVILGYLLGPVLVAKYALTMFTSTAVQGVLVAVIAGMTPGICSLFGKGDYDKVKMARKTMSSLMWLFSVSLGVAILLLNKSFIHLWVGGERYAGNIENLFILLVAIQVIFFQFDSSILNATLDVKRKVVLSACATTLSVGLSFILVSKFQIIGLCISILIGRLFYTIRFPVLLKRRMNDETAWYSLSIVRPVLISMILFVIATYGGQIYNFTTWVSLIFTGIVTALFAGVIFWILGMPLNDRKETKKAISGIKLFKMK